MSEQNNPKSAVKEREIAADWNLVMDSEQVRRSVARISHEILERNGGAAKIGLVGIRTRGEYLAQRIQQQLENIEGTKVPLGVVDITLYRDDISKSSEQPLVRGTHLPFNLDKLAIILIDDVLFTGRTVRAALDALIDFGRPQSIQLAVLCDRGHRELPIRADYVGKNIPTARSQSVEVCLAERDGMDAVYVHERKKK